jgi:hypothetical protein
MAESCLARHRLVAGKSDLFCDYAVAKAQRSAVLLGELAKPFV